VGTPMGLGMRESSGRYCEAAIAMLTMSRQTPPRRGCSDVVGHPRVKPGHRLAVQIMVWDSLLEIFRQGVVPHSGDLQNYGSGDGAKFQEMCKSNPQFAADCAAIGVRAVRTHWGPINRREAQIRQEVIDLLIHIEIAAPLANHRENDLVEQ